MYKQIDISSIFIHINKAIQYKNDMYSSLLYAILLSLSLSIICLRHHN